MIKYNSTEISLISITLIIIFVGVFGNILNLFVFRQKSMFKIPTFRLLFYLSLVDLIIIIVCTNDLLFTFAFKIQMKLASIVSCRFHTYLTSYLTQLSSVILTTVSIERAFLICNKQKKIFTIKYIERLILAIVLLLAVINWHYLFFFNLGLNKQHQYLNKPSNTSSYFFYNDTNSDITPNISNYLSEIKTIDDYKLKSLESNELKIKSYSIPVLESSMFVCYPSNNSIYNYFFYKIWTWIHSSIYSFIPIIIMILCSIFILIELNRKNKRLFRISANFNRHLLKNRFQRKNQVIFMLISTNLFFIVCSLPYCISHSNSSFAHTEPELSKTSFVIHVLAYSNNSINFLFYSIFSSKFRKECSKLLTMFKLINLDVNLEVNNLELTYSHKGRANYQRKKTSNQLRQSVRNSRETRTKNSNSFSKNIRTVKFLHIERSNDGFKTLKMIDDESF